jgi:hypothetical protein
VLAFVRLAQREWGLSVLARDQENFRAALERPFPAARPPCGSHARWEASCLPAGLLQEGRDWLERALSQAPVGGWLRADLLRLLGTVLYEAGDLERARR